MTNRYRYEPNLALIYKTFDQKQPTLTALVIERTRAEWAVEQVFHSLILSDVTVGIGCWETLISRLCPNLPIHFFCCPGESVSKVLGLGCSGSLHRLNSGYVQHFTSFLQTLPQT